MKRKEKNKALKRIYNLSRVRKVADIQNQELEWWPHSIEMDKQKYHKEQRNLRHVMFMPLMKNFVITGSKTGLFVNAHSEGEARRLFHFWTNGESIVSIKLGFVYTDNSFPKSPINVSIFAS